MTTITIKFNQEGDTLHCRAYKSGEKPTPQEMAAGALMLALVEASAFICVAKGKLADATKKRTSRRKP